MTMTILRTTYREPAANVDQGVPVVLVHAFPIDHRVWDECASVLCAISEGEQDRPFALYGLEMPGAGECPVPSAEQTGPVADDGAYPEAMDRMAESFVREFLSTGHTKAVWVGISMGGYLTLAVHRLHPEVVAGVVLCDTKSEGDGPTARANRLRIANVCETEHTVEPVMHFAQPQPDDSDFKKSPAFIDLFTRWINEQHPEGVAWRQRMAAGRPDETPQLAKITVPAGLVSGTLDPSSAPDRMRPMLEKMTGTECAFTTVYDAGHFTCVEKPDVVARAILDVQHRASTM
ncbi:alpha/beta fold hydrolase [Bifidobacterium sp. UTCIF-39]|uniref:alpha/beta fold hydrolase n=1 Tax=Bifidobacterium sp. UTCIF-39 TaxID=1465359 RepID=UPI002158A625|nr:alpha/beta hydrolase [Bifidobacterium sp. UTCIF-39]